MHGQTNRELSMGNSTVFLDEVRTHFEPIVDASRLPARSYRVDLLRGREAISKMRGMLMRLSERVGQLGTMTALDFYLSTPSALRKTPYLALVGLRPGISPEQATAEDVEGVVLLHEYKVYGWGTQVFATDDHSGERSVIAPAEIRAHVAEAVCRMLMDSGAVLAMISLKGDVEPKLVERSGAGSRPVGWMALQTRFAPRHLQLAETLETTLATLGKHTRRNLRYYRRRLEASHGAVFVPNVEISLEEFLEVNRISMYPVDEELARARYDYMRRMPGAVFAGVRSGDGQWLSLIGGRRLVDSVEIVWQMNHAGMPRHSLSTVMRSYLIEHEISLGTTTLEFEGGTGHSMRHSFVHARAMDIIVLRNSWRGRLLRRLANRVFPQENFVRRALLSKESEWKPW
jgi:hypothetical protein